MNSISKKTINLKALAVALALGISGSAMAGPKHKNHDRGYTEAWGKVTQVTPIYRQIRSSVPVQQCWQQPVTHTQRSGNADVAGSTLAGGIIGGIIGHQIGKGDGRKVATAFGTLIGAQLGHDAARGAHGTEYSVTRQHKVCETTQKVTYEEVLDGYRVRYSYRGNEYETITDQHPGKRIRLEVSVTPVVHM